MTITVSMIFLILAIVCFLVSAFVSPPATPNAVWSPHRWLCFGLVFFTVSFLLVALKVS